MNTIEYVEAVKKQLRIESDYALAKHLDIPRQTASKWSRGKSQLGDENAIEFAKILEMPEGIILADMHAERATDTHTRNAWARVAQQLSTVSATVILAVGLAFTPAQVETGFYQKGFTNNIHYAQHR